MLNSAETAFAVKSALANTETFQVLKLKDIQSVF